MGELRHIDRVAMSVDTAAASALGAVETVGIIAKSWQRCIGEYGLEPDRLPGPTILTSAELRQRCDAADDLLMLAREELERLFEQIGSSGYFMTMTDDSGVVVAAHCTADLEDDLRKAGTVAGSIWLEEQQGTNGVGTCLKEHNSLSIVQEEHFGTRLMGLTCTVAPIFRSTHQILGVINVTTPRRTDHAAQHMVRKIIGKAALRIENLHLQRQHAGRRILRLSRYGDFVDLANEARLVLDDADRIVAATPAAGHLLKIPPAHLVGRSMPETLGLQALSIAPEMQVQARLPRHPAPLYVRMLGLGRPRPLGKSGHSLPPPADGALRLFGEAPDMLARIATAQRLFAHGLPVMLQGETGSGKTALARLLHDAGPRAGKPIVTVNCAAIPQDLIEGELFGHRPGAFTGASRQGSKGLVREADGGTLFLDEIGDMPLLLQTRLLHVLSEGVVAPLGGGPMQPVDLAVISASLQDIPALVARGGFRQDLFFRLNGATVSLPPLRERADRESIIDHVIASEARAAGLGAALLSPAAAALLMAYAWPGNLRELRHVARHAVAMAEGVEILPSHLPASLRGQVAAPERTAEREGPAPLTMVAALEQTGWNVSAAARLLGISRATVHRHLHTATLRRQSLPAGKPLRAS